MQREEEGEKCKAFGKLTLLTRQNTYKVQFELL